MRILLVEDDPGLRHTLLEGLAEAGHRVDAVTRGEDAMHELTAAGYGIAIVDWRLPGMSGVDLIAWLRRQHLPTAVLMLTARDAPGDRVRGLDAGADDYLVKPFDFAELLARLRALERRPRDVAGPILTCGDLALDPALHVVRAGERELALTATEYRVLETLMRHAPAVVERRGLAEEAWGEDEAPLGPGAIDVQLSRLRAKISGSGARIVTMRGTGYRIEPA